MISITTHITGNDAASAMADDMEETAQFFPSFAARLDSGDLSELEEMLGDELFSDDRSAALRKLAEMLLRVCG
jgi:hypothetical protein